MSDALGRGASALGAAIGKGLARETPAGKRKGMSFRKAMCAPDAGGQPPTPRRILSHSGSRDSPGRRARRREGRTGPPHATPRVHGPPLPHSGFLLSRVWTYGRAAACPQPKNAVPFKRNGNKSAAGSLELFEGLLEVQDHIPSVLDANREAHQVLPDPEPLPPRRRELAVRGGGRMDGEGVDVS
jgi:hypothetical protein